MRKFYLIPALALALASCSNDDLVTDSQNGNIGDFETNFLSVNIVPAPDMSSRADKIYEDGEGAENTVKKVRFYFFDAKGGVAPVRSNGSNYFDWSNDFGGTNPTDENIEKQLKAVVVINTKKGDKGLPEKIVAIINPSVANLDDENLSLDQLRAKANDADYAGKINAVASDAQEFLMNNSVYAEGQNEILATTIPASSYAKSEDEALNSSPVNIYVERNVAKVRVKFNNFEGYDNASNIITLKDKDDNNIKVGDGDGKQVYLKLEGWNVTAETDLTKLFKSIDPTGASLWSQWNNSPYFRSFWAQNAEDAKQSWHNYKDIKNENVTFDGKSSLYLNENAPQNVIYPETVSVAKATKVIIAGTLQDEEGNALNIAKYAGLTIVDNDEYQKLKETMIYALRDNMIYYYERGEFKAIESDDVEIKTAFEAGEAEASDDTNESTQGRYNVYLQLKDASANKQWYKKADVNEAYSETDGKSVQEQINEDLIDHIGRAQVYNGGKTYYYFPIQHLAPSGTIGAYGVVRNHIYDCNITGLKGLGTPVFKDTETIYPEKPEDDDTFIAAKINILSWRLVTQNVNLNW